MKLALFEMIDGVLTPHYQLTLPLFEHQSQSRDPWGHELLHVIYGHWHHSAW